MYVLVSFIVLVNKNRLHSTDGIVIAAFIYECFIFHVE